MKRRLRIGRILGVDVAIDWSWIVTFVLVAWTWIALGERVLPTKNTFVLTIAGAALALGVFASLAFHELARGLAARACGIPVTTVTLFVVGGMNDGDRRRGTAVAEAIASLVAPIASAAFGIIVCLAVVLVFGPIPRSIEELERLGALGAILLGLGIVNLVVAALSFLPAWPLDGGRLLRAAMWRALGDYERATRYAAWVAQVIGWQLVIAGLAVALASKGAAIGAGMWLALVGWYLSSAAAQAYEGVVIEDALAEVRVERLMRRTFLSIAADVTVATAARGWQTRGHDRAVPVVSGEQLVGFVTPRDVRSVVASQRDTMLIAQIARCAPVVSSTDALLSALACLDAAATERVAVVHERRLVGVLERADLTAFVEACRLGNHGQGEERVALALAGWERR